MKTVSFGEVTNFMATKSKYWIANVKSVHIKVSNVLVSAETCVELGSYADTIVLGKEYMEIYNYNRPVKVPVWNPKDREMLCHRISGLVAYDHPQTWQVYLLILNQCIYADHLDHHIFYPMQCRIKGVDINETPKLLLKNPINSSHVIIIDEPEGGGLLVIPLLINRVTSYFTC